MGTHTGGFHQQQVPGQVHALRHRRNPRQPQTGGHGPFVGTAARAQRRILGPEHHRQIEGGGIFQGTLQHQGAGDLAARIAHGNTPCLGQGGHFRQLVAGQTLGHGGNGHDARESGLAGLLADQPHHGGGIHRSAVRLGHQVSNTTRGGGAGFAGNVATATAARQGQVHTGVYQPGQHPVAFRVHDIGAGGIQAGTDAHQTAIFNQQVGNLVATIGRIDHPALANQDIGFLATGHAHLPCGPGHCFPGR